MTEEEREEFKKMSETMSSLTELAAIVPDVKELVKERQEQEIFNRKAAKIGRTIILLGGGIGTLLGTIWGVSKLIFTLGSNG